MFVVSHLDEQHLPTSKIVVSEHLLGCTDILNIVMSSMWEVSSDQLYSPEIILQEAQNIGLGNILVYKISQKGKPSLDLVSRHTIRTMEYSLFRRKIIEAYLGGEVDQIEVIYHKDIDEESAEEDTGFASGDLFIRLPHDDLLLLSYADKSEYDDELYEVYEECVDPLGEWDVYITDKPVQGKDDIVAIIRAWLKREFGSNLSQIDTLKIALMLPGSNVIPIRPEVMH